MTVRKMCLSNEGANEENLINQNDVGKTCVRVRMSEKLWETASEIVKASFSFPQNVSCFSSFVATHTVFHSNHSINQILFCTHTNFPFPDFKFAGKFT